MNGAPASPPWAAEATRLELWRRYCSARCDVAECGLTLDVSRVCWDEGFLDATEPAVLAAFKAMAALEAGATANATEQRMVGHYWLRAAGLAPPDMRSAIETSLRDLTAFAAAVRNGEIRGTTGRFENVIHVGVGGSTLGAQLLCDSLAVAPLSVHFLDNADPDGIDRLLRRLDGSLGRTLVSVVSKSGWTPTTQHISAELELAYRQENLSYPRHAVATTMHGTPLDERATAEQWLATFPLWDWVGGRTSVTAAAGLLPAALGGVDIASFLAGAAAMDARTRIPDPRQNPAALLALAWMWLGDGQGRKRMVVLPYKDRLSLFGRYVQQLVMESVGKRYDRSGDLVEQGFTVFGHKGSSDGHSYMQQLRDGTADAFVTFIGVDQERSADIVELEPGVTLGDYLAGYLEAARDSLYELGRESITIGIRAVSPRCLGALVALYERAVGIYAELVDVNAYDQPGVDKDAAAVPVALQQRAVSYLVSAGKPLTAEEIANGIRQPEAVESIFKMLERLAADGRRGVLLTPGARVEKGRFHVVAA